MYRNDLIMHAMKQKGLSSITLAQRIAISDFTIRRVMKGGRVEIATLHIIAAGLGLNIKDLFEDIPTGAVPNKPGIEKAQAKKNLNIAVPSLFAEKIAA
jgi:ribosome-binding protein aMBF1 (putative translation factor)